MALFHQCLDHPYLFGNMAHGGGFRMGRQAIKGGAVPVEQVRPACGEFRQGNAGFLRIPDGFVIHIRQIANVRGGNPPQLQDAAEDVPVLIVTGLAEDFSISGGEGSGTLIAADSAASMEMMDNRYTYMRHPPSQTPWVRKP